MITRQVIVEQIECTGSRVVQIRFQKQLVEDGTVVAMEYHRTAIEPGIPAKDQLAEVNAHLNRMGWPAVAAEGVDRINAICAIEHTPAVVEGFQAARVAQEAIMREMRASDQK